MGSKLTKTMSHSDYGAFLTPSQPSTVKKLPIGIVFSSKEEKVIAENIQFGDLLDDTDIIAISEKSFD